ncbi:MAG TPA: glycoside hydrolase family 2 TIM barrel-domain containing protein [Terriglobia bacterium]|nr:glycoside hydrolase family 2 TIM barrel-domain containing protein [Terriglobia bacterium]
MDFGLAQGPSAPQLENLALHAQAAGSPGAVSEGSPYPATGSAEVIAGYVNDGDLDTLWGYTEPAPTGAWLSLTWPQPITFRQILVRQNLDRDLTQITLEVREGGQWKTLKMLGDGNIPLPKLILIELPAQTTDAIRLTRLKGVPSFYEVEVYEGPNPPVINLAGDAAGRIIGMVSDAFGAGPKTGAPITISGQAGHKLWQVRLCTDEHGMFTVATPAGLLGLIRVDAQVGAEHIEHKVDAADLALKLTPPNDLESAIDLNGSWKFAPDPPAEFHRPDFADVRWRVIEVPSHWVMQGFQSEHGVCGYRRQFQLPTAWTGQRIKIRFEGVYSGAEVWLNGQRAGWHEGGFTPFEVDITNAANPGVNVLALRVTENTPSTSLDHMSFYADFPLAGIFRRAYAFAVPIAHVERFHIATLFDSNFQDAVLRIDLRLVNEGAERFRNAEVRWELQSPDGTPVMAPFSKSRFNLPAWSHLERTIDIPISRPQHWEAEHPKLYRLTASLYVNGTKVEQVSRRIGFRQVDIRGTQVLINGTAVKFRGACHHDSHPVMGRAVTPEVTRQDLELIKEANLDALRTSHYPAVEELYDYADEMGVYIEAEAPFCWVDRSHDLRLVPLVVQHTAELLERDRSHPSVIWWSLCNESSWGPVFERSHEYVKRSDPTRPTSAAATQDLDLATRHNPITLDRMQQSNSSKVPVIWDESLCVFQGMYQDGPELWRDPGERDYYIVPLIPIWDALLASDVIQGSMIWAWSDDIFQVPGRGSEFGRRQTRVHGVDQLYGAPGKGVVGDAPWGVVDGWRRKKPEFWHTKKLHSPIKVLTLELPAPSAGNLPPLRIHNRYEFTNLEELTLSWEFGEEKGQIHPRIAPQRIGEVQIPVRQAATPGSYLTIRFLNRDGKLVDEEEIRVASEAIPVRRPVVTPLKHRKEKLLEGNLLCIRGEHFEIAFETDGSGIRRLLVDGRALLFETPVPHILPTNPSQSEVPSTWSWQPVKPVAVAREGENMIVTAAVRYREVEGNVTYRIMPAGELLVSYDVKYLGPELYAHEVGLRFGLPPWMDILEWERKGEWSAYPEDHVGRNRGKASGHPGIQTEIPPVHSFSQDDSALGSNDFRSIKRHFKCASLVSREGYGLQILSDGKQHLRAMVKPDHIAVHVCDWFGGTASTAEEWKLNYGNGRVLETNDTLKGALHLRLVTPGL